MNSDAAEAVALRALAWLAGNDELLPVFLGATGASVADLRDGANSPEFLGSLLDFLLMDDAWLISCGAALELPPESFLQARAALPGGQEMHWT